VPGECLAHAVGAQRRGHLRRLHHDLDRQVDIFPRTRNRAGRAPERTSPRPCHIRRARSSRPRSAFNSPENGLSGEAAGEEPDPSRRWQCRRPSRVLSGKDRLESAPPWRRGPAHRRAICRHLRDALRRSRSCGDAVDRVDARGERLRGRGPSIPERSSNRTRAPRDFPIQFRCIISTRSGQPPSSSAMLSSNASAYCVMRKNHCSISFASTRVVSCCQQNSVDDLLVRKHGLAFGAPVHTAPLAVSESALQHS
jgi:hypothetical protein